MSARRFPAAASGQAHLVLHRGTTTALHDEAVQGQPFPLAADCVGRPLVPIAGSRIARAFNEPELEQLIRDRLEGPPRHVRIDGEGNPWRDLVWIFLLPFLAGCLICWLLP